MSFLLRWFVRLGLLIGVPALLASSQLAGTVAAFLWTGYLFWAARHALFRDVSRLWAATSFRSYSLRAPLRLGRLKGDTL